MWKTVVKIIEVLKTSLVKEEYKQICPIPSDLIHTFAFKHSATTLTCVSLPENDSLYHLAYEWFWTVWF